MQYCNDSQEDARAVRTVYSDAPQADRNGGDSEDVEKVWSELLQSTPADHLQPMPSCRRKRVVLTEPSEDILKYAQLNADVEVYVLQATGEVFDSYESYSSRCSFYSRKQFQCDVTGKSGLNYFEALASEQQAGRTLHSRFPEPLKAAVLSSVQWQVMGRLDHLVEAVYERFKDRYFTHECIYVDVQGEKVPARVVSVKAPTSSRTPRAQSSQPHSPYDLHKHHLIGGDLTITPAESVQRDNPVDYLYRVEILHSDRNRKLSQAPGSHDATAGIASKDSSTGLIYRLPGDEKLADSDMRGSSMEVTCDSMSRDRLTFSKSLLRRFLRDCLDRDSSLASPWMVKDDIARRYHVPTEMPAEIRANVEKMRKGEMDKRRKTVEGKDPRGTGAAPSPKKAEAQEKGKASSVPHRTQNLSTSQGRSATPISVTEAKVVSTNIVETPKKKPVRYPTEDLDVRITERDKKAGLLITRPRPRRDPAHIPFNEMPGTFTSFLATWNFFQCFGQPLHLSPFSLDDYEHALKHGTSDPPCPLLAEMHSVLIYNLRTIPCQKHAATISLLADADKGPDEPAASPSVEELVSSLADIGNNWERVPLKHSEGRAGWEEALIGCLKDHATTSSFPAIRHILTSLMFASSSTDADLSSVGSSTSMTPPSIGYSRMQPHDRIAILQFMCDLAVSSKSIHGHLEHCDEQLTTLRKEKIETNRQRKQCLEDKQALTSDASDPKPAIPDPVPDSTDSITDMDTDSVLNLDDGLDDQPSTKPRSSKGGALSLSSVKPEGSGGRTASSQRDRSRAKDATSKQVANETRRLDDEISKLEKRLDGIEREFRKLLGMVRIKPLGKDRFFNRYWWFDGHGTGLTGNNGNAHYGTGRVFIQGASEFDEEILGRRAQTEDLESRREEEEGEDGRLGTSEWGVYAEPDDIDALISWLNPKGYRELALKNAFAKWSEPLLSGLRKRATDSAPPIRPIEARRSTRGKLANSENTKEVYMSWVNRKATT